MTERRAGGDVIDRHVHNGHQLIYVTGGVLAIQTDRGAWVASVQSALWVPSGIWHEHRFYGHCEFHTVGFETLPPHLPEDMPAIITVEGLVRELIVAICAPDAPSAEIPAMRTLLSARLRRGLAQPLMLPNATDPRLVAACAVVNSDLSRPRTLGQLAAEVNTSERTLSRLFRSEFEMTYPQWRTKIRVFAAMVLLADGATVTHTAHACGWATASAFVDAFRRAMGTTPGIHRLCAAPIR
ncbi:helix-turn-helix transcriptional regulator [Gordonia jinhuaensis]|nr:AraC family transcriptional regulator [Gordonia jinhuaensis]